MLTKVFHIEFTKANHIGADESISPRDAENFLVDQIFNTVQFPTLVEEQERVAEHGNADDKEGQERDDVNADLAEHTDKCCSSVKQSKPIEEFDIKKEDRNSCSGLLEADI